MAKEPKTTAKIGDSTFIKGEDGVWVDKSSKQKAPDSLASALNKAHYTPSSGDEVVNKLDELTAHVDDVEKAVLTADKHDQKAFKELIDRVNQLNKTFNTVANKIGDGSGSGSNNTPVTEDKEQPPVTKLKVGGLLKNAVKQSIGDSGTFGSSFMEKYNKIRPGSFIHQNEAGEYINSQTGKQHSKRDYDEEQLAQKNKPGRLGSFAKAGLAGVGGVLRKTAEGIEPTGILRNFNRMKDQQDEGLREKKREEQRIKRLKEETKETSGSTKTSDSRSSSRRSNRSVVTVADISGSVIDKLANAISKAMSASGSGLAPHMDTKSPELQPMAGGDGPDKGHEQTVSTPEQKKPSGGLMDMFSGLLPMASGALGKIGGSLLKGTKGLVSGVTKIGGKGLGTMLKTAGRGIPLLGAGISGGLAGFDEYKKSGNIGKSLFAGGGSALGALGGEAVGSLAGPVGTVAGGIAGGSLGEKGGAGLYDMLFGGKKQTTKSPMTMAVNNRTSALNNNSNNNSMIKSAAAKPTIISGGGSSGPQSTVINNNQNNSTMMKTAGPRGSLDINNYA